MRWREGRCQAERGKGRCEGPEAEGVAQCAGERWPPGAGPSLARPGKCASGVAELWEGLLLETLAMRGGRGGHGC